jgi:hypothetical protein
MALSSPTSGGRSASILCLRTKATEFSFFFYVAQNRNDNSKQFFITYVESTAPKPITEKAQCKCYYTTDKQRHEDNGHETILGTSTLGKLLFLPIQQRKS